MEKKSGYGNNRNNWMNTTQKNSIQNKKNSWLAAAIFSGCRIGLKWLSRVI